MLAKNAYHLHFCLSVKNDFVKAKRISKRRIFMDTRVDQEPLRPFKRSDESFEITDDSASEWMDKWSSLCVQSISKISKVIYLYKLYIYRWRNQFELSINVQIYLSSFSIIFKSMSLNKLYCKWKFSHSFRSLPCIQNFASVWITKH